VVFRDFKPNEGLVYISLEEAAVQMGVE